MSEALSKSGSRRRAGKSGRAGKADLPPPADVLTIDNLETLRLLADPLRMQLLSSFAEDPDSPLTVKQVAERIGARPTKLYYHVNLLEEHGLLRVASSRVVSGIIEKSYLLAARSVTVDSSLVELTPFGREAAAGSMAALLQTSATEIEASMAAEPVPDETPPGGRRYQVSKTLGHLSPEQHAQFLDRLTELIGEFEQLGDAGHRREPNRALLVAYYAINRRPAKPTRGAKK